MARRALFTLSAALQRQRLTLSLSFIVFALFSSTLLTLPDTTGHAKNSPAQSGAVKAEINVTSGLQRVIFITPQGSKIFVNLPQDIRPGEIISGTVFAEASAKTDAKRDDLRNYIVEIGGQKIPATGKTFELKIPDSTMKGANGIVLRDEKGKEVARGEFSIASQPSSRAADFSLPTIQLGEIIEVGCPCDGVMTGTDYVKVGGKEILMLAESPRKKVAFNTTGVKGLSEIEVSERGQVTKARTRILGIKLSAAKTGLRRGEQTTLMVEVTGLEDLKEAVPLRLENKTTSVLTMEPSNVQELTIGPSDVQSGGSYTTRRTLTGIQVGNFFIEGTVVRRDENIPVVGRNVDVTVVPSADIIPKLESDQERARLRNLLIQKIQNANLPAPPPPEIALVSPATGVVRESRPTFRWKISNLPGEVQKVSYTLKVVEVLPEQSLDEALLKNSPVLERGNLTSDSFQFPERGTQFTAGKTYAWNVTAFDLRETQIARGTSNVLVIWPNIKIPLPLPSCIFIPLATTFQYCVGGSLTVGFAIMPGTGPYQWTLSPSGGSGSTPPSTSTIFTPINLPASVLPTTPGTYTYTLTVTRGTCSQTVTITIVAFPAGAVGGSAVVSTPQICDGGAAVLDVQGETGNVGQWEYSDTGIIGPWLNATSAFFISGAPTNTNPMSPRASDCAVSPWYTQRWFRAVVSTSSAANAPSCSLTRSGAIPLRIYCKPKAGTVTANTTRICKYANNPPVVLQMSTPIIGDFDWYANGVLIPGSHNQNPFTVPAPTVTTTYNAIVTTNGPCSAVSSNSVTVIVDNQPFCTSANTALSADTTLVCPGDAAVLTLSNCSGTVTWQQAFSSTGPWPGGSTGPWPGVSSGNSVQNTTDLFSTTYWRAIIEGPPGSVCPAIISNVVAINVKPPPAAPVVATPAPVCFGGNATLTASPPPAGVTYQWYHDDIPLPCTTATCTFPAEPGNYWVEASNGCETVQSNFVTLPVEVVTVKLSAPCCATGSPVTLSATATSSLTGQINNPALYTWYQGTTPVGTGMSITVNPQSTTQYCVRVSSPTVTGCSGAACTIITVCP